MAFRTASEGPKTVSRRRILPPRTFSVLAAGLLVALPCISASQTLPQNASPPHHAKKKKAATPAVPATPVPVPVVAPVAPPNLLEQPAAPATVTEHNNTLTVKADNSSLTQILRQVSSATGMHLDGLGSDERVFGSFGPAAPREVLTSLLNGTAYNVMMVGDLPNGAPRQLLLTRKTDAPKGPTVAPAPPTNSGEDDNADDTGSADDPDNAPPPPPPMVTQPRSQPGVPGVRTPQDIQEQLQRMRNLQGAAPQQ